jgi:hypothetical protein
MTPTYTRDATNKFVAPENWQEEYGVCGDLYVRVAPAGGIVEHTSTWKPSAEELVALNAGYVIEIALSVHSQPVMRAYVVEPCLPVPKPRPLEEGDNTSRDKAPITINEDAHGHG